MVRQDKVKEIEVLLKVLDSQRATLYTLGIAEKALETLLDTLYNEQTIGFKTNNNASDDDK